MPTVQHRCPAQAQSCARFLIATSPGRIHSLVALNLLPYVLLSCILLHYSDTQLRETQFKLRAMLLSDNEAP